MSEGLECHRREDLVDRLVHDSKPSEFVEWMVKYHGLPESSRRTVEINLQETFHYHRLRGRLDRWPAWAALAELILRRRQP